MRTRASLRTAHLLGGMRYEVHSVEAEDLRAGDMVHCRCEGMLQTARFLGHRWNGGRHQLIVAPVGKNTELQVPVGNLRGILILARKKVDAPTTRRPTLGWLRRRGF